MMNKKLIALLMTAITVSMVSARFCHDEDGNRVSCTGRVVEGTVDAAGTVAEGTVDTAGDVVHAAMPWNWGEGGRERREERRERREARRYRD
jgi:hypothetical protein